MTEPEIQRASCQGTRAAHAGLRAAARRQQYADVALIHRSSWITIHTFQVPARVCTPCAPDPGISSRDGMFRGHQQTPENPETFINASTLLNDLSPRHLWRLQDPHDGVGPGFTIEPFFLALRQLLFNFLSPESHSALFMSLSSTGKTARG